MGKVKKLISELVRELHGISNKAVVLEHYIQQEEARDRGRLPILDLPSPIEEKFRCREVDSTLEEWTDEGWRVLAAWHHTPEGDMEEVSLSEN